jgi:hypothetical protein
LCNLTLSPDHSSSWARKEEVGFIPLWTITQPKSCTTFPANTKTKSLLDACQARPLNSGQPTNAECATLHACMDVDGILNPAALSESIACNMCSLFWHFCCGLSWQLSVALEAAGCAKALAFPATQFFLYWSRIYASYLLCCQKCANVNFQSNVRARHIQAQNSEIGHSPPSEAERTKPVPHKPPTTVTWPLL